MTTGICTPYRKFCLPLLFSSFGVFHFKQNEKLIRYPKLIWKAWRVQASPRELQYQIDCPLNEYSDCSGSIRSLAVAPVEGLHCRQSVLSNESEEHADAARAQCHCLHSVLVRDAAVAAAAAARGGK